MSHERPQPEVWNTERTTWLSLGYPSDQKSRPVAVVKDAEYVYIPISMNLSELSNGSVSSHVCVCLLLCLFLRVCVCVGLVIALGKVACRQSNRLHECLKGACSFLLAVTSVSRVLNMAFCICMFVFGQRPWKPFRGMLISERHMDGTRKF